MRFYDVTTKREYEKDGIKKNIWLKVGTYKETEDGKRFLELNMFPTTSFYIFEQKSKEDKQTLNNDTPNSKLPDEIKWAE